MSRLTIEFEDGVVETEGDWIEIRIARCWDIWCAIVVDFAQVHRWKRRRRNTVLGTTEVSIGRGISFEVAVDLLGRAQSIRRASTEIVGG
jgi:hypothetical protein